MHTLAILAMDGVIPFDLATPIQLFAGVQTSTGTEAYDVRVCAPSEQVEAGWMTVRAPYGLDTLGTADTIMVPGLLEPWAPVPTAVLEALRQAAATGTRIASICVGAFTLAAAGLLEGRRATTHWAAAEELAQRYPGIEVDPNVLYVDSGQILTSAGAAAGLDLCLHMVRCDFGAAAAADAARTAVMPLERTGGQAQFIAHPPPGAQGGSLEPLLQWMTRHLGDDLALDDIAAAAMLSTRTLSRRFRQQTGTTPLQWLQTVRLRQAQHLLETTDHTVERIATTVGFGSTATLRERFRRDLDTTPHAYRRAFGRNTIGLANSA
jgi:transcriptional regulator GlxA family with amidase domain